MGVVMQLSVTEYWEVESGQKTDTLHLSEGIVCLCNFSNNSLLQDAESKSETSQAISAREHFVFTDTDGQVYHITVEGNTVKDGARIPPDVSPETMCLYISFYFTFSKTTSRSSHSHPGTNMFLPPSYLSVSYVI